MRRVYEDKAMAAAGPGSVPGPAHPGAVPPAPGCLPERPDAEYLLEPPRPDAARVRAILAELRRAFIVIPSLDAPAEETP
jgi:hypothetical protein